VPELPNKLFLLVREWDAQLPGKLLTQCLVGNCSLSWRKFGLAEELWGGKKWKIMLKGEIPNWKEVTSGVLPRCVWGLILFNIFNNFGRKSSTVLMKFSDNAICNVNVEEDSIQEELAKLWDWNNRNGMNSNNPKGEVRHFRTHNFSPSRKLWKKTWEWIIWSPDDTICDMPVENTNGVLKYIRWGISSKHKYQCRFVTQITSAGN